ncbi:MAG: Rpn family recombination-promoting nuclease/putative transposase [Magnetococcales bacterium]|nr:Rpn family recombination-promoting nuclease/putative transposase [Magnetococcales bacterium]
MTNTFRAADSLYHRFFAHPEMVADLLRAFLDPAMLGELDLEHLRRHNTKFTARKGERRRSDVVWEIPTHQGGSIFVLLLLEFQSEVVEWMALRIDVYVGLLYQQLVSERKLKEADGLPPVLPIVLFNGKPRWNAATSLRDLIRLPTASSLWRFQPDMRYYLIDEGAYLEEVLEGSPYLTAILFRMEHPGNLEVMVRAARDVTAWFAKHPDGPPVKQLFHELLLAGLTRLQADPLPAIPDDLQEVVIMLTAHIEQWAKDYEKKALDYEQKGRLDGERKGGMEILLDLLQDRFGSVPDWVRSKLVEADLNTLKSWSRRIFEAEKIEHIFQ